MVSGKKKAIPPVRFCSLECRLVPASDGGDDLSGLAVRTKGLGLSLVSARKRLMTAWIDKRSEYAAFEPSLAELGEEAFDGVEPGGRFRDSRSRFLKVPAGFDIGSDRGWLDG
jgi:hypothetical protein